MSYLHWHEEIIADMNEAAITRMYERGYVLTRKGRGVMQETRSCRIDLARFALSSENRRILKKTEEVTLRGVPLPYAEYDHTIGKLAKDFYDARFGPGIMSANKVREMLTAPHKGNFNCLYIYDIGGESGLARPGGYAICYTNSAMHHYSYPFYDLSAAPRDMGLGMMVRAVQASKELGHRYIYLGSLQRPGDTYKLQFSGLEWWDGGPAGSGKWRTDLQALPGILGSAQ